MKTLLLLDTSTSFAYSACFRKEGASWSKGSEVLVRTRSREALGEARGRVQFHGDRWLSELIQYLLQEEKLDRFDYLALGKGPGFFTSLRIGHVTLATLALLWKSMTLHFSSLLFWREFFGLHDKKNIFILRANQNLYYLDHKDNSSSVPFLTMNAHELAEFAKKNPTKKFFLWEEAWQSRSSARAQKNVSKKVENPQSLGQKKEDGSRMLPKTLAKIPGIRNLTLEESLASRENFVPDFLAKDSLESMGVGIHEFLPLYGKSF